MLELEFKTNCDQIKQMEFQIQNYEFDIKISNQSLSEYKIKAEKYEKMSLQVNQENKEMKLKLKNINELLYGKNL